MKRLFSPWRSKYIQSFSPSEKEKDVCVLCRAYQAGDDDGQFIVMRGKTCFGMMNLFPYNSGHLMVIPYRHTATLQGLSDEECLEVMSHLKSLTAALLSVSHPEGFNIGSNIGRTAGAGIDQHVHFHLVPRWSGDTNFMPILADTKLISEDMRETFVNLREALSSSQR